MREHHCLREKNCCDGDGIVPRGLAPAREEREGILLLYLEQQMWSEV